MPNKFSIHGIDVSKYQSVIDWHNVQTMKVKDIKIGFVFIKATEGIDNVDAQYRNNMANAKKAANAKPVQRDTTVVCPP